METDLIELCRKSWEGSRTELQPAYDDLLPSYQAMLIKRAEEVLAGSYVTDGPWQGFEILVRDSTRRAAEQADAEKAQAAEPEAEPTTQEEKEHLELKGALPSDFPSLSKLHEARINTYGQLNKVEDLTTIDGIGPATAKAIKKRLKAEAVALNK